MTITLTPEIERILTARAAQQGTTPEILALHDLGQLYAEAAPANRYEAKDFGGQTLADVLAGRIGRIDSRERNGGQPSRLSEDETSFGEYLEEKREQGHL